MTIYFGVSFEYVLDDGNSLIKTQDRAKFEYIYVIDIDKVESNKISLGINCPNCGAFIKNLGEKNVVIVIVELLI